MNPRMHGQCLPRRQVRRRRQALDLRGQLQRRFGGSATIVFPRALTAKNGQYTIALHARDQPAMLRHHGAGQAAHLAEQLGVVLCLKRGAQPGRIRQVGEQIGRAHV